MNQRGIYGQNLAEAFKVASAPAFVSRQSLKGGEIGVTQLRCDVADDQLTSPCVEPDAFMMMLQLRDWPQRNLWADDRPVQAAPLKAGAVSIFDLARSWVGHRVCPIHQLNFYLPQSALDAICDIEERPRIREFHNDPLAGADDVVIHRLGMSILRAFDAPDQINRLFIEHVTSAAAIHAVTRYGVARDHVAPQVNLSADQLRRAFEMIAGQLDGEVGTAELAAACGLPLTAFVDAFQRAVGKLPHQWLLDRRIERAMTLARTPLLDEEDIALSCGFADATHLDRVFEGLVGISLQSWRLTALH